MVLNDPLYRDSFGTAQNTDFHFSVESTTTSTPGWYNEASVHRIVWDLFDTANDGADTVSVGYAPMHDVFMTELRNDVPLTALFPFITALKLRPGVPVAPVDAIVEAERGAAGTNLGIVSTTMTPYAATETFSGVADSSSDLVLPVYTPIALGGSARLCTSSSVTSSTGTVIGGSPFPSLQRAERAYDPHHAHLRVHGHRLHRCDRPGPGLRGYASPECHVRGVEHTALRAARLSCGGR
jgi:hypothetical protein